MTGPPFDWNPAEIQARAIVAAAAAVERMLELAGSDGAGAPARGNRRLRTLRAEAERMAEATFDSARAILDGVFTMLDAALAGDEASTVLAGPVQPGASATVDLWLHALDGPSRAPAPLHLTPLTRHDGVIAQARATFSPAALDLGTLRSSMALQLTIDVDASTGEGRYHGHVLACGAPEISLPITMQVEK